MKITRRQLRRIIQEQVSGYDWSRDEQGYRDAESLEPGHADYADQQYNAGFDDGYAGLAERSSDSEYRKGFAVGWGVAYKKTEVYSNETNRNKIEKSGSIFDQ